MVFTYFSAARSLSDFLYFYNKNASHFFLALILDFMQQADVILKA